MKSNLIRDLFHQISETSTNTLRKKPRQIRIRIISNEIMVSTIMIFSVDRSKDGFQKFFGESEGITDCQPKLTNH